MTLNLMLTSRDAVYLSGDFRITSRMGNKIIGRDDDVLVQKIVPVVRRHWSALVAWAGAARTPTGEGVGDWIVRTIESIGIDASFEELPSALLQANGWLKGGRNLAFSVVGFIGQEPVAIVISNVLGFNGQVFNPLKPTLEITGM